MPMRANSPIVWSNSACPVEPQPRVDGAAQLTPDFADFELRSGSDRPTRQDAPAEIFERLRGRGTGESTSGAIRDFAASGG
jgi:hypothetical protein